MQNSAEYHPIESVQSSPGTRNQELPAAMTSLSIVIPAYNEEKRLPPTLKTIAAFLSSAQLTFVEIIVVDDGSTDGTADMVRSFPGVTLLSNPGNRGKGYSVRHGALKARGEWVLITDADLSSPIEELTKLAHAAM